MKVNRIFHTDGSGLWSKCAREVKITKINFEYDLSDVDYYGWPCLYIHFTRNTWKVKEDGLIYTDHLFIKELREYLTSLGLPGDMCEYSEQGAQGWTYVHCEVNVEFIDELIKKGYV